MERREFIALLGGGALAWPLAARAQQPDRMRRVGVLMGLAESDPGAQRRLMAFQRRLQELGWIEGRNVQIDYRWSAGKIDQARSAAKELAGLQADVIVGHTILPALALAQATSITPIVFTAVGEPIFYGLVASLMRPGGNITGFTNFAPALGAKLLELLKTMAPGITRVAVMFNPDVEPASVAFASSAETAANTFAVEHIFAPIYEAAEIEVAMTMLAREPGGGLILPPNDFTSLHQQLIIALAARYRLPTIYGARQFTAAGGLMSYGIDPVDQFQSVAGYVDRILRGEKPAELPVQAPTKFELAINLKTAKALGLDVPPALLARADEVIE
jgi:putative tryptophan/tyrosine transport system substrate-binding protein